MFKFISLFVVFILSITTLYIYGGFKTASPPPYDSAVDSPISLDSLSNINPTFIKINLSFFPYNTDGWPNVFQTAPLNNGIRLEQSGRNLLLLIPSKWLDKGNPGLKQILLTSDLTTDAWHDLEIEAINGELVKATYDGQTFIYKNRGINFSSSRIIIGSGFVNERQFKGKIKEITIEGAAFPASILLK